MKESAKTYLTRILIIIFCFGLIINYGIGVYHSFNKHGISDGITGVVLFPWAINRGIEFWWHKDYTNEDSEKKFDNEMQACIYFIISADDMKTNSDQINKELIDFSEKMKNYPEDKKEYLKTGTKIFILYSNSIYTDFVNSLNDYKTTGSFKVNYSPETKSIENELSKYNLDNDIELPRKRIDILNKQMSEKLSSNSMAINIPYIEEVATVVKSTNESRNNNYKQIIKILFNEN